MISKLDKATLAKLKVARGNLSVGRAPPPQCLKKVLDIDISAGARISGRSSSAPLEYAAEVTEGERKRKGKGAFEAAVDQPSQKKTKGGVPESVDDGPSVLVDNEEALKRASGLLCEVNRKIMESMP